MISEGIFLPVGSGRRLCLVHRPHGKARGVVVHVPAFAEEMNKSRRQVALAARAMADEGYAVVIPDLFGCGDSSGEFGEAGWDMWLHDILVVCRWAEGLFGGRLWMWGLRAGALLAVQAANSLPDCDVLLWQPVASGKLHLNQFLRLKVVNEALAEAATRSATVALHARLRDGESQEIAGYLLPPSVARGLDAAELVFPEGFSGRVVWLEVGAGDPSELMPRSQLIVGDLVRRGVTVAAAAVSGPLFWQTVEITECPILVRATTVALGAIR